MIPVEHHLEACLALVEPLAPVPLPLLEAVGLLVAEPVVAGWPCPPFDNSAMDGFAVHGPDVAGATDATPVQLPVVGEVVAGPGSPAPLAPGTAVRIMTGAPVPPGTGLVVPLEWTAPGTDAGHVLVQRTAPVGTYLRRAGDDVRAGEQVLAPGARVTPRTVALLASVGRATVSVRPRPRVAVLSTGAELVPAGAAPGPGLVPDTNGPALAAAVAAAGARCVHVGLVDDDPHRFAAALETAAVTADVVVTSGGVSMGTRDVVKEALAGLGTVAFARVAMQPGMPQGHGTVGARRTPLFALPGNPVSAQVAFELFVRPVLRRLAGETTLHRTPFTATAATGWTSPGGKRQYVRAAVRQGPHGALVEPVGRQGSHLVADLAAADCLAVVPEGCTLVRPGDALRCLPLDDHPLPAACPAPAPPEGAPRP